MEGMINLLVVGITPLKPMLLCILISIILLIFKPNDSQYKKADDSINLSLLVILLFFIIFAGWSIFYYIKI